MGGLGVKSIHWFLNKFLVVLSHTRKLLNLGGAKGPRPGATLADAPHTYLDVGVRGLRYTIAYVMGGDKRVFNSAPTELSYILL